MGTSAARTAPSGKLWRRAKTSAARFASGKASPPPQAQEVISHYLTALASLEPEAFPDHRGFLPDLGRTAASLGEFYQTWRESGRNAALARLGLPPAATQALLPDLADRLAGAGSRLDEAVVRAALVDHFASFPEAGGTPHPAAAVRHFLGLALYHKMQSDLGEPLEFHSPSITQGLARLASLKASLLAALELPEDEAQRPPARLAHQATAQLENLLATLGGRHEP